MNRLRYTRKDLYADLLYADYLLGFLAAYLLGAEKWIPFVIFLVIAFVSNRILNRFYWRLMNEATKK
mgnify:CR=1 FL=1